MENLSMVFQKQTNKQQAKTKENETKKIHQEIEFTRHLYQRQSTIKGIGPQAKSAHSSTDKTQIYEVMFNFQVYLI